MATNVLSSKPKGQAPSDKIRPIAEYPKVKSLLGERAALDARRERCAREIAERAAKAGAATVAGVEVVELARSIRRGETLDFSRRENEQRRLSELQLEVAACDKAIEAVNKELEDAKRKAYVEELERLRPFRASLAKEQDGLLAEQEAFIRKVLACAQEWTDAGYPNEASFVTIIFAIYGASAMQTLEYAPIWRKEQKDAGLLS